MPSSPSVKSPVYYGTRLLLITWNYPPKIGGIEKLLYLFSKEIQDRTRVDIITPALNDVETAHGIKNLHQTCTGSLPLFMIAAFYRAFSILNKKDDIIILSGSMLTCPIAVLLGFIFKKKVITYVHGLDILYGNFLYQRAVGIFLSRNHMVLANSSATRDIAVSKGVSAERVKVLHPGIIVEEFQRGYSVDDIDKLKQKYGVQGKKVLLTVGRLTLRKGIPEFIERSFVKILSEIPEAVLFVVGSDPKDALVNRSGAALKIRAAEIRSGINGSVIIYGHADMPELVEIYHCADIFVFPVLMAEGDIEGFGMVSLEAAASKKPCVGFKVGGIPESIGEGGVLIEPGDYDGFSRAILHLLKNDGERIALGGKGYNRVEKDFTVRAMADNFFNIISKN